MVDHNADGSLGLRREFHALAEPEPAMRDGQRLNPLRQHIHDPVATNQRYAAASAVPDQRAQNLLLGPGSFDGFLRSPTPYDTAMKQIPRPQPAAPLPRRAAYASTRG